MSVRRLLAPLGPLIAGLLGVFFGRNLVEEGSILLVAFVTGLVVSIIAIFFIAGKSALRHYTVAGAYLMESGALLILLLGAIGGGFSFWALVELTAGKEATPLEKQTLAGVSGAFTTYLGSAFGKADLPWNPVKKALKSTFKGCFSQRRDDIEKDAHDALQLESYGSMTGGTVSGWDWSARRARARQIQAAVDKRYASK
jgi:hypothetical protein